MTILGPEATCMEEIIEVDIRQIAKSEAIKYPVDNPMK